MCLTVRRDEGDFTEEELPFPPWLEFPTHSEADLNFYQNTWTIVLLP